MTPIETAFNEHAAALRALGASLTAANSVRYEPSPGMAREGSRGIPNPTLDTVLDPRRAEVSAAMTRAAFVLWKATEEIQTLTENIDTAVARWQGETIREGEPATA